MGRGSKGPVMMVKILLLEHLYRLSNVDVSDRINTDVAFRWFLGLGIDDTTISHFRVNRLGQEEIHNEYESNETVSSSRHFEIVAKQLQQLFLNTDIELQINNKYHEAFGICYDIIDQCLKNKKDKIVSVVDPDARVAHKSVRNIKRGDKDHIIVAEDSEIILASTQTPFI